MKTNVLDWRPQSREGFLWAKFDLARAKCMGGQRATNGIWSFAIPWTDSNPSKSLAAHGCGRIAMASASCLPSLHHHANPACRKVSARSIRPPMEPSGVPPWPTAGWQRYVNAKLGAVTIFYRLLMAKRARGRFDILAFAPKPCCLASPNSVHHRQLRSGGAVYLATETPPFTPYMVSKNQDGDPKRLADSACPA